MRPAPIVATLAALLGCGSSDGSTPDAAPVPTLDAAPGADASAPADAAAPDAPSALPDASPADGPGPADGAAGDTTVSISADAGPDAGIDVPAPRPVTMQFTGTVATVAGAPLGLDSSARTTAITGTFTYDLRTPDARPADPKRGRFEHGTTSGFTFSVLGHTIEGSGYAVVQTEDLDPDTFRFLDGPGIDTIPRIMKLDGTAAPMLKLGIAITDSSGALFKSDALPDPFPMLDIASTPHTFSLSDGGGTLLMQLTSLTKK